MIKIGIFGFGNISKAIIENAQYFKDIKIVAIFSRHCGENTYKDIKIYKAEDVSKFVKKIDVMMICTGSQKDTPKFAKVLVEKFNTIDCYDDHKSLHPYYKSLNKIAKENNRTAIISVGWDPGIFSLLRGLLDASLPNGDTQTFWGPGISQGHSEAIRRINGVVDARQYTIPNNKALKKFNKKYFIDLSTYEKHKRLCFVVANDNSKKESIKKEIVNMPHYFKGYKTEVKFVTKKQLLNKHNNLFHGGIVQRIAYTGANKHTLLFKLKTESNPSLTASIMIAYARANIKLQKQNKFGAFTIFEIPISSLLKNKLMYKLI